MIREEKNKLTRLSSPESDSSIRFSALSIAESAVSIRESAVSIRFPVLSIGRDLKALFCHLLCCARMERPFVTRSNCRQRPGHPRPRGSLVLPNRREAAAALISDFVLRYATHVTYLTHVTSTLKAAGHFEFFIYGIATQAPVLTEVNPL